MGPNHIAMKGRAGYHADRRAQPTCEGRRYHRIDAAPKSMRPLGMRGRAAATVRKEIKRARRHASTNPAGNA